MNEGFEGHEVAVLRINVNGKDRVIQEDLDPEIPLLWVLRDSLNMVGTKFGCGASFCGACTVHINGEPTRVLPSASCDGGRAKRQGHDHRRPCQ